MKYPHILILNFRLADLRRWSPTGIEIKTPNRSPIRPQWAITPISAQVNLAYFDDKAERLVTPPELGLLPGQCPESPAEGVPELVGRDRLTSTDAQSAERHGRPASPHPVSPNSSPHGMRLPMATQEPRFGVASLSGLSANFSEAEIGVVSEVLILI